ncbi:MAG: alkaline phosphatase family protein [Deltaproteobacteria bacterium]|nr:alkaline phosphatase family protein [Deltaproteobacteria bacterium]
MRWRLVILLAALAITAGLGIISVRIAEQNAAILDACGAVESSDWNTVLKRTENLSLDGGSAREAAECRCIALVATNRGVECESLMDRLLADPASDDWSPNPSLAVHLIQTRRSAGRIREAADLARRAAREFPSNGDLFFLELSTRSSVEDEALVLRELEARIDPEAAEATRMKTSLATRHLIRGDARRALDVLGTGPPTGNRDAIERWYDTKGMALASIGDLPGVRQSYLEWAQVGGNPFELEARYALTLSIAGLADPDASITALLSNAIANTNGLIDEHLLEALATRLILTLVDADEQDEALATYDRYEQRFAFAGLTREELERSAIHHTLDSNNATRPHGTIRFSLPRRSAHDSLLISPPPEAPVDTDFELVESNGSRVVEVSRPLDVAPVRWVYRDEEGSALASGTVNPEPGAVVSVSISPGKPRPPLRTTLSRKPADGHRRVLLIMLDCGDWRLTQYLRTRNELPVLDGLLSAGYRSVLDSDPPLTAAALEALVWPERRGGASFVGLVHQIGVEVAGLSSIGENPFGALSWLLPEDEDLFAVLGSKEHSAANLLFSHGGIRAGRHSEITGPNGQRQRLSIATSSRDLDETERRKWPGLVTESERDAVHLRTIAAEFDTAAEIARAGEIDFLALRIESLDILTHSHFAQTTRTGQDDANRFLYELYRYIDTRLGEVHNLLDEDDIFIVMSDHGIRTAMEHSRHAMFIVAGQSVPVGRADGRPALRGVSAVVADLMGIDASWPRTGVAPWAGTSTARNQVPITNEGG